MYNAKSACVLEQGFEVVKMSLCVHSPCAQHISHTLDFYCGSVSAKDPNYGIGPWGSCKTLFSNILTSSQHTSLNVTINNHGLILAIEMNSTIAISRWCTLKMNGLSRSLSGPGSTSPWWSHEFKG